MIKRSNLYENMKHVLDIALKKQKAIIVILVITIVISACDTFMIPYMTKMIIELIVSTSLRAQFYRVMGIYAIIMLVSYLLKGFCDNQQKWRVLDCRNAFMRGIFKKSATIEYEKLENTQTLDACHKAYKAARDEDKGLCGMLNTLINIVRLFTQTVVAVVVIVRLSPVLVLIISVLAGVRFIPTNVTQKKDKAEVWDKIVNLWRKFFGMNDLTQDFHYGKDIRLFNMSSWIFEKHLGINKEMQKKILKSRNLWMCCHGIERVIMVSEQIILYGWVIIAYFHNKITIADFTLYVTVMLSFSTTLSGLLWEVAMMKRMSLEVDDYFNYVGPEDLQESIEKPNETKERPSCLLSDKYEIVFENVWFKYDGQDDYALKGINVTIPDMQKLAIVGTNGAGKSTFVKLLCRLYEPTEGRILINGIDIKTIDKSDFYTILSPIFQNIEVYPFSLLENVSMRTAEETNRNRAEECIKIAGLSEKVERLEKGMESELSKEIYSDGVILSGGEYQKLALARALYKDSPIVLLDEPTAALDPLAEYKQYQIFNSVLKNHTAIYISHRLASTKFCDCIAMFVGGQIVEYGTHDELLAKKGQYAAMFDVQAKYYRK